MLEKLEPDFDYNSFDRFRYIRNGINYYGKTVELTDGKNLINKILQMRKSILKKLETKIK